MKTNHVLLDMKEKPPEYVKLEEVGLIHKDLGKFFIEAMALNYSVSISGSYIIIYEVDPEKLLTFSVKHLSISYLHSLFDEGKLDGDLKKIYTAKTTKAPAT